MASAHYDRNKLKELLDDDQYCERYRYRTEKDGSIYRVVWGCIRDGNGGEKITRLILEDLEEDNEELRHFIAEKERELEEDGVRCLKGKSSPHESWRLNELIKLDMDNGWLRDHLQDLHNQHARTFFRAQSDIAH